MNSWSTPRVGLGCMRLTDPAAVHAALAAGIRLFDTAVAYGEGEALLARALAADPRGAEAAIITKVGMIRPDGRWQPDGRAATIARQAAASAELWSGHRRMVLLHAPDPGVAWTTSLRALARLADDDWEVGVANVSRAQLDEALDHAPIRLVQVALSALDDTAIRSGVLARCVERGLWLQAHRPLGSPSKVKGLLRRPSIAAVARRRDVPPAAVALAAVLAIDLVVQVIPGASRVASVEEVARALDLVLSEEDLAELVAELPALRSLAARRPPVATRTDADVVLVMGPSGAGKSMFAAQWEREGYLRLNRDADGGSLAAIATRLGAELDGGVKRVILDNTLITRAQRARVLEEAARRGVPVRGWWIAVDPGVAQANVVRRMLTAHGRLLGPAELTGTDNTRLPPRAVFSHFRQIELPDVGEGFAALEFRPAVSTTSGVPGRIVAPDRLELPIDRPTAVLAWRPDGSTVAVPEGVTAWVCTHPAGPPICWCRPPLPGLALVFARDAGVDLTQSEIVGGGPAFQAMAAAVGATWRA